MTKMINVSEPSICGTRCQTDVSQKIIAWTCLKRDATPTFLLDGVIFDVIGDSLSEHLTLSTVY